MAELIPQKTNGHAAVSPQPTEGTSRRDFLTTLSAALGALVLPGCGERKSAATASEGPSPEHIAKEHQKEREQTLLSELTRDRNSVLAEMRSSPQVSGQIKSILSSENFGRTLENAARVFSEARTHDRAIEDLRSVEARFGLDTRLFVAALLQQSLPKAFAGLSEMLLAEVSRGRPGGKPTLAEIGIKAPASVAIDGAWGPKSSYLREGVQELTLRLSEKLFDRPTPRPRPFYQTETAIGPNTLGVIRWFDPRYAAFMVPSTTTIPSGEQVARPLSEVATDYEHLRTSGQADARMTGARRP